MNNKLKVIAVYDSKVEAYMQPMFFRHAGEAIRAFEAAVRDENSNFSKWPADYTLMEIALYDETSGKFESHLAPISYGNALEFKSRVGNIEPTVTQLVSKQRQEELAKTAN